MASASALVRGARIFGSCFDKRWISTITSIANFDFVVAKHQHICREAKGLLGNFIGVNANSVTIRHCQLKY